MASFGAPSKCVDAARQRRLQAAERVRRGGPALQPTPAERRAAAAAAAAPRRTDRPGTASGRPGTASGRPGTAPDRLRTAPDGRPGTAPERHGTVFGADRASVASFGLAFAEDARFAADDGKFAADDRERQQGYAASYAPSPAASPGRASLRVDARERPQGSAANYERSPAASPGRAPLRADGRAPPEPPPDDAATVFRARAEFDSAAARGTVELESLRGQVFLLQSSESALRREFAGLRAEAAERRGEAFLAKTALESVERERNGLAALEAKGRSLRLCGAGEDAPAEAPAGAVPVNTDRSAGRDGALRRKETLEIATEAQAGEVRRLDADLGASESEVERGGAALRAAEAILTATKEALQKTADLLQSSEETVVSKEAALQLARLQVKAQADLIRSKDESMESIEAHLKMALGDARAQKAMCIAAKRKVEALVRRALDRRKDDGEAASKREVEKRRRLDEAARRLDDEAAARRRDDDDAAARRRDEDAAARRRDDATRSPSKRTSEDQALAASQGEVAEMKALVATLQLERGVRREAAFQHGAASVQTGDGVVEAHVVEAHRLALSEAARLCDSLKAERALADVRRQLAEEKCRTLLRETSRREKVRQELINGSNRRIADLTKQLAEAQVAQAQLVQDYECTIAGLIKSTLRQVEPIKALAKQPVRSPGKALKK